MTLTEDVCWEVLAGQRHGSLGTIHPTRGVDVVPVVFALLPDRRVVIPVDTVKPKRSSRLQRVVNVEHDSRCVLLVEHYEEDWSQLWWVRLHATAKPSAPSPPVLEVLAGCFAQYESSGSIVSALILTPSTIRGWSGSAA